MEHAVFSYGTLLVEEVLEAILGRVPDRIEAELVGYKRLPIQGKCYPAVIRARDTDVVKGKLLVGLSAAELQLLDKFEDPAYDRRRARVQLENGEMVAARVWARADDDGDDLEHDMEWDIDSFMTRHGDWYILRCADWARENRNFELRD